ncbi:MAG: hypothetical protein ACYTFM_09775 [Planctomycetota bacterium]|jgi:hypothetical protein
MSKYLLEVPHEENKVSCEKAVRILLSTGSHFMTNAQFGCHDGVHKAWVIVDVDSKEEARAIIPTEYRNQSLVVKLTQFSLGKLNNIIVYHGDSTEQVKSG